MNKWFTCLIGLETIFQKRQVTGILLLGLVLAPLFLGTLSALQGCDMRKPLEGDSVLIRPPLLELSTEKDALGSDDDTVYLIQALLVNAFHGTLPQRAVTFAAKVGFIASEGVTNDSGKVLVPYYPRSEGLTAPKPDTIIGTFEYSTSEGMQTIHDTLILVLIPGTPSASNQVGSIELSTSRTSVQVKGSGNTDQAVISARVLDTQRNPVKDGVKVTFRLLRGPGGGETMGSGLTDTASTTNGIAAVTFHGGTAIGVVEIQASSGTESVQQALLTVTSGPPEHIDITVRKDSVNTSGNRWRLQIQAALTDAYLNPVKDSIGVLFSLDTSLADKNSLSIQGSSYTGIPRCSDTTEVDCQSVPGSAFTTVTYRSELVFSGLRIRAETSTGSKLIQVVRQVWIPLQRAQVKANYFGGAVFSPYDFPVDTVKIEGLLQDGFGYAVPFGTLCMNTDGGVLLDTCRATGFDGKAQFRMTVTNRDQTSLNPFRVINVRLIEQSTGTEGTTSFMAIFQ
jgi:hypothetical protein